MILNFYVSILTTSFFIVSLISTIPLLTVKTIFKTMWLDSYNLVWRYSSDVVIVILISELMCS